MKKKVFKKVENRLDLAMNICTLELGSKQVDIAQVQEILSAIGFCLHHDFLGTASVLLSVMREARFKQTEMQVNFTKKAKKVKNGKSKSTKN